MEAICPTGEGDNYVWTRKRVVPVKCDVRIGERRIRTEALGVEDESCGYHPHTTVWDWSAGVGETRDGRAVGWNLVAGVNDPERGSERAIWVDGAAAAEPPPATFHGLEAIEVGDARLEFTAEAERRKEQRSPFAYSYRQPFGTFTGTLPGRPRARLRPRGDGAPRGELVAGLSRSASRDRPSPRASATAAPRPVPTRTGCARRASPAARAPGSRSSSRGVGASRETSPLLASRATHRQPSAGRYDQYEISVKCPPPRSATETNSVIRRF